MTERLDSQSPADKPSRLTKDGLELSIATQRAREKLGELDVTVSIPGFIDLCQLAIAGLSTARSAGGQIDTVTEGTVEQDAARFRYLCRQITGETRYVGTAFRRWQWDGPYDEPNFMRALDKRMVVSTIAPTELQIK